MNLQPLDETFYRRKLLQIQSKLTEANLEGILILELHNVIYTSGFFHSPSERPIGFFIPERGEPTLFIPLLEQENAQDTWIKDIRSYFEFPGETHPIEWMLKEINLQRLAVDQLDHALFITLEQRGHKLITSNLIDTLRYVKEPEELVLIRKAASYADLFLDFVVQNASTMFREGASELDLLNAALSSTKQKQAQDLGQAFAKTKCGVTATVHTGPRAALPHGKPLHRKPNRGEGLIAGIGASVGGYHAESGATFILGKISDDQMRCLKAAAACNDAAIAALKSGVTCAEVNRIALETLKSAGLENYIRHRIGHGMGIQGHEAPWLAPGDDTVLLPGMVFSNEPGIYRPDIDGYRTINTMIVTEGEAEVPSRFQQTHPLQARVLEL
jgi:Xaa-Pro aminopeptidase